MPNMHSSLMKELTIVLLKYLKPKIATPHSLHKFSEQPTWCVQVVFRLMQQLRILHGLSESIDMTKHAFKK